MNKNTINKKESIETGLKNYGFIKIDNTDLWKKQKEQSRYYMYVILTDNDLIYFTQTESGADAKKTSFNRWNLSKMTDKEYSIFGRVFLDLLSFFEK